MDSCFLFPRVNSLCDLLFYKSSSSDLRGLEGLGAGRWVRGGGVSRDGHSRRGVHVLELQSCIVPWRLLRSHPARHSCSNTASTKPGTDRKSVDFGRAPPRSDCLPSLQCASFRGENAQSCHVSNPNTNLKVDGLVVHAMPRHGEDVFEQDGSPTGQR